MHTRKLDHYSVVGRGKQNETRPNYVNLLGTFGLDFLPYRLCYIFNELLTVTLGTPVTTLYTYSAEDQVFYVERQIAMVSGTIKAMLMVNLRSPRAKSIPRNHKSILEKVIQYFHFKNKYITRPRKYQSLRLSQKWH